MEKIKILIGDDNPEIVSLLRMFFSMQDDFEIVGHAHNGLDVLDLLSKTKPDILLLDIIMPKLDGIGVLERMSNEQKKEVKVIMLTALGQTNVTQQAIKAGAAFFVLKPFDLNVLALRVKQVYNNDFKSPSNDNTKNDEKKISIESRITAILHNLGCPPHLKGYLYLREAIKQVYEDVSLLGNITKVLYPSISEKFDTTYGGVERSIRHALEVTFTRGNIDYINDFFGSTIDNDRNRPTNSEFIAKVADVLRIKNN